MRLAPAVYLLPFTKVMEGMWGDGDPRLQRYHLLSPGVHNLEGRQIRRQREGSTLCSGGVSHLSERGSLWGRTIRPKVEK